MTLTWTVERGALHGVPLSAWAERFWPKVDQTGECWTWTKATNAAGYGRLGLSRNRRNVTVLAHRLSWILHFGDIPEGVKVLHRCDNPPCVRPGHLFLGTQSDNMQDCIEKGRRKIAPVSGDAHPRAKVTAEVRAQVHRLRAVGMTQREIGAEVGLNQSHVSKVLRGVHRTETPTCPT